MKFYYSTLFFALLIIFSSCDKDELTGPAGPAGSSGASLLKQGFVEGKINGNMENGDTINESFRYEYYASLEGSRWYETDGGYGLDFSRRDLDINNIFEFTVDYVDPSDDQPNEMDVDIKFHYLKDLGNGTYLKFGDVQLVLRTTLYFGYSDSELVISNYQFDQSTGNLKFDFRIDYAAYENHSGNPAVVTGKVDVNVGREVYRKGIIE